MTLRIRERRVIESLWENVQRGQSGTLSGGLFWKPFIALYLDFWQEKW